MGGSVTKSPVARYLKVSAVLLLLSTAIGCGSRTRSTSLVGSPRGDREIHVIVENQNFYDVRVYYCRGSHAVRLGAVSSSSQREFSFPWTGSELQLMVDFIGAGQLLYIPVSVTPGESIVFRIGATMHNRAGSMTCGM
ncbi:MAG: hypothetical protein OEZ54_02095 [Gemmatimonadota bacterium]|nr:hypothetical protein [Gemmatimonadota bacterium]